MDKLELLYQRVSVEAKADTPNQGVFAQQLDFLLGGINRFVAGTASTFGFTGKTSFKALSNEKGYSTFRRQTVYRPIHLAEKKTVLELAELAFDNITQLEDVVERVINPWRGVIANFITNPEELGKMWDSKHLTNGKLVKFADIKSMEKDLKKVYDVDYSQHTDEFGNMYRNIAEFDSTRLVVSKANKIATEMNLTSIMTEVKDLNDMASRLAGYIADSENNYDASRSALDLLADGSYALGKELEFLAITVSILDSLSGALTNTEDKLKDVK